MLVQYLDLTKQFNENNGDAYVELSNYDYCIIQTTATPTEAVALYTTLDDSAYLDDNKFITEPVSWLPVFCRNLKNNNIIEGSNSIADAEGMFRVDVVGKYLRIYGNGASMGGSGKLLVMLAKIS